MKMEREVVEAELVLPTHLNFKKIQMYEKYPKGQPRGRHKHLKQIIQAENYQNYGPDDPNFLQTLTLSHHRPCFHRRKFATLQDMKHLTWIQERTCGMLTQKSLNSLGHFLMNMFKDILLLEMLPSFSSESAGILRIMDMQ